MLASYVRKMTGGHSKRETHRYAVGGKMEDVFNKVADIICAQLNIDKSAVTMDSEIIKDLGADSLDIIEMLMSFEDEYGISIPDEVSQNLKTVGDIVALIEKK